jgi:hypothetical protein
MRETYLKLLKRYGGNGQLREYLYVAMTTGGLAVLMERRGIQAERRLERLRKRRERRVYSLILTLSIPTLLIGTIYMWRRG